MATIRESQFRPPWWLKSPHLQTIWPTLMRRPRPFEGDWERIELKDGDFIELAWMQNDGPLVMLLHGLEGSLQSHYAIPIMQALHRQGFSVVFMHLRGCSRTPNRLARSYHSGATEDLLEVLQQLEQRGQPVSAVVGISLGGNLLLKYLGETGTDSGLAAAIAVSVPFHLDKTARHLQRGAAKIYQQYLLRKLLNSYRRKFSQRTSPLPVNLKAIRTLFEFDDRITAPLHGFEGADDYYHRCSAIRYLQGVHTPTLIIHSRDDPFMPQETTPVCEQLGPGITLELSQQGGHVGFVYGQLPWKAEYWLESRISDYLLTQLRGKSER
jgi:predicted alpha/beta-fold hydrolase